MLQSAINTTLRETIIAYLRAKMDVYAPRGWIVAATAYRSEFVSLIDSERLADLIPAISSSDESYSMIVRRTGELAVHPQYAWRADASGSL